MAALLQAVAQLVNMALNTAGIGIEKVGDEANAEFPRRYVSAFFASHR